MTDFLDCVLKECAALEDGTPAKFDSDFDMSEFRLSCNSNASLVLQRVAEVILIIDKVTINDVWLSDDEWSEALPNWFVSSFLPNRSAFERSEFLSKWEKTDSREKEKIDYQDIDWRLKNWIYFFEEDNRNQFIERIETDGDSVYLTVASLDLPIYVGPLEWLGRCAGASSLQEIN